MLSLERLNAMVLSTEDSLTTIGCRLNRWFNGTPVCPSDKQGFAVVYLSRLDSAGRDVVEPVEIDQYTVRSQPEVARLLAKGARRLAARMTPQSSTGSRLLPHIMGAGRKVGIMLWNVSGEGESEVLESVGFRTAASSFRADEFAAEQAG